MRPFRVNEKNQVEGKAPMGKYYVICDVEDTWLMKYLPNDRDCGGDSKRARAKIIAELLNFYAEMIGAGVEEWEVINNPKITCHKTFTGELGLKRDGQLARAFNEMRERIAGKSEEMVTINLNGKEFKMTRDQLNHLKESLEEI